MGWRPDVLIENLLISSMRRIGLSLYECPFRHPAFSLTQRPAHIILRTSNMALMPPPPPPPTSHHPIGLSPPADDSDHDSDSGPESDTDTATPSALSPSTPRRLPLNSDDETSDLFLKQLKSAVESYPSLSSYCCGGSIPVSTTSRLSPSVQDSSKAAVTSPPITLRFDAPSGVILKLSLPASPQEETTPTKRKVEVEELLAACTPDIVTDDKVGRGQRVRSRKSSARLDKDSFSVDVHPADLGILDTIKQVLLPDVRLQSGDDDGKGKGRSLWDGVGTESWRDREEHWGVRAELCELRVSLDSKFLDHANNCL
ncbi:hypothetical protein BJ875DRAFT_212568 [Amylocarpus encephaloides]|uniref:Uncharacterized protein n=1 Tax=Amylocarpus encephaloides TaxID=45428 RepID=A0A9P7YMQ1_9HELO|nr:hypothetical protein BJ875DRAFT_212568 [Amylocarpus encephaloides]